MPTRKDTKTADYFQRYVNIVKENDVTDALSRNNRNFKKLIKIIPKEKIDYAYAEGKWTIKEVLQHIIDAERIFVYRALRFARKDATALASFDENSFAANAKTGERKWKDLVQEFKALRKSTILFFESLDDEQLLAVGTASGNEINVIALGFITAGHVQHHLNIIKAKYL